MVILAFLLIAVTLLWFFSENLFVMGVQWRMKHFCQDALKAKVTYAATEADQGCMLRQVKIEKGGEWNIEIEKVAVHIDCDWKKKTITLDILLDSPHFFCLKEHPLLETHLSSFSLPYFDCIVKTTVRNGRISTPSSVLNQHAFCIQHQWMPEGWECTAVFYEDLEQGELVLKGQFGKEGRGKCSVETKQKGALIASELFNLFIQKPDTPDYLQWKFCEGEVVGNAQFDFEPNYALAHLEGALFAQEIVMDNERIGLRAAAKQIVSSFDMNGNSFLGNGLNGTFRMSEGEFSSLAASQKKDISLTDWNMMNSFCLKESHIVIRQGQIERSSMKANWLGMEGELSLNWLSSNELVHFQMKGESKEMIPFLPIQFQQGFLKAFPEDLFFLDAAIKRAQLGIDLEGMLQITTCKGEAYHFDFGCQLGKSQDTQYDKEPETAFKTVGLEIFLESLSNQFHLAKRRIGWFRGRAIAVEKFISPFLFRDIQMQANGLIDIEGTFDDRCLILFYDGKQLTLESPHFLVAAEGIKCGLDAPAVHYIDFSTFEHVGVLPLSQVVYKQKNLGLNFDNGSVLVHFENKKIFLKQIECQWKTINFQGEVEIDIRHLDEIDLRLLTKNVQGPTCEVREFFSHIIPSMCWNLPLEGEIKSGEDDVFLHFEFKPKSKLVDGYVKGILSTSFSSMLCRVENYTTSFEYNVCKNAILFSKGEGIAFFNQDETTSYLINCPELTFYHFPFPQIAMEMHLWKEGVKIFSCVGHTEGSSAKREFFLEGDSLYIQGIQEGSHVTVNSFEFGNLKGAVDLSIDEKGCHFHYIRLKYADLGAFAFEGKFDFKTALLKGELNNLIIDLNALTILPHLATLDTWVSLWKPRGKLCGQGEVCVSFLDKTWSVETLSTFHELEFGGIHFGDGENLKCHYSSEGLVVKGLEGEIPGENGSLKYRLGQLQYHPESQKIAFDEFDFSLPPDRLSNVTHCASLLFPGKIHPSLIEWIESVKQQESLEGRISVTVFPDRVWVYLTLKDGQYFFNGHGLDLKRFSLLYDSSELNLQSACTLYGKEYWAILSMNTQTVDQGALILMEHAQAKESLVFHWQRRASGSIELCSIKGGLSGLTVDLERMNDPKGDFNGSVDVDAKRASHLLPYAIKEWTDRLSIGKGYRLQGHFNFGQGLEELVFHGGFQGQNFSVGGMEFESLSSEAIIEPNHISIHHFNIQDKAGKCSIETVNCHKQEGKWRIDIPKVEFQDLRMSHLKKGMHFSKKAKSSFRSLIIPQLELAGISGILGEKRTFIGKGELRFTNLPPKNLISNLLMIPTEITARIGLDLSLLVPVRGTISYEIREGKIHFLNLDNMYSEGKHSRFYLAKGTPAYLDFDGHLNLKIKMKQYNLLMKLAELFTVTVKGTLFKPTYTFTNQSDESEQDLDI